MISPVTLDNPAAYFERLAAFEATHWWSTALWRIAGYWLDTSLHGRSGLDAIDVGCGAGLTLRRLADRPEITRVVGLDPCGEALTYASRWGHRVVEGSALALPFETGTFDVATCLDVVQHLPPGGIAMSAGEIARVLRLGGVAVIRSNAGRDGVQLDELTTTFADAGFNICHASPVNAFGSFAQEIRGRLRPARHRAHPSGGGLPRAGQGGRADQLMAAAGWIEAYAVGRLRWSLPFGHSAMLLAIREA